MNTFSLNRGVPGRRICGLAAWVVGLALGACGADPANESGYGELFARALSQVRGGQVPEGEALMRQAVRLAEGARDHGSVYWNAWLLAQHRSEHWTGGQRLVWFEVAEGALAQRDRGHFKWMVADLPNYVQLLCEKETVLAAQGRMGEAYAAQRKAADLARLYWGPMESDAEWRRASARQIGILLNLWLDQAHHLEQTGQMDASEALFQRCRDIAVGYLEGHADQPAYLSRIANNYAVMLGRIGRDEAEEKVLGEAFAQGGARGDELIVEANRLRRESRCQGPSAELHRRLAAKADQLQAAGRQDAALETLRRAASVRYELGEVEPAEELFEQVVAAARRQRFNVAAANALYWRAKARGQIGHPGAEADFLAALEAYRAQGAKLYEARLYQAYAGFLGGTGRLADALRTVNESVRLNRSMNLVHLRPELLALKAHLLFQAGHLPAADAVWQEILGLLRDIPGYGENRRLNVQMARLRHLARCGRDSELAEAMEQTRAFVAQSRLTDFQAKALRDFDPEAFRGEAAPEVAAWLPVDLQPVFTSTHTQPREPAQTGFWLMNPALTERRGRLQIRGAAAVEWGSVQPPRLDIELRGAESGAEERVSGKEIVLAAESVLEIHFRQVPSPQEEPSRIVLDWQGDDVLSAEWHVAGDADRYSAQSTFHQHFARHNAFTSVPLYHEIGVRGTPVDLLNFRMVAGTACRVEMYDAESLSLLAVDADGDGRFNGAGDVLARDLDRDGHPDADRLPRSVVFHVFPVPGGRYGEPLDLTLEILDQGEWRPIGSARLIDVDSPTGSPGPR